MALPYCPVPPAVRARVSDAVAADDRAVVALGGSPDENAVLARALDGVALDGDAGAVQREDRRAAVARSCSGDAAAAALQHDAVSAEAFDRAILKPEIGDIAQHEQAALARARPATAIEGDTLQRDRLRLLSRQQRSVARESDARAARRAYEMRTIRQAQTSGLRQPRRDEPGRPRARRLVDLALDACGVRLRAHDMRRKHHSGTDQSQHGTAGRDHASPSAIMVPTKMICGSAGQNRPAMPAPRRRAPPPPPSRAREPSVVSASAARAAAQGAPGAARGRRCRHTPVSSIRQKQAIAEVVSRIPRNGRWQSSAAQRHHHADGAEDAWGEGSAAGQHPLAGAENPRHRHAAARRGSSRALPGSRVCAGRPARTSVRPPAARRRRSWARRPASPTCRQQAHFTMHVRERHAPDAAEMPGQTHRRVGRRAGKGPKPVMRMVGRLLRGCIHLAPVNRRTIASCFFRTATMASRRSGAAWST